MLNMDNLYKYWFSSVATSATHTANAQLYQSIEKHAKKLHPFILDRIAVMASKMTELSFVECVVRLNDLVENFVSIDKDNLAQVLSHRGRLDE